MGGSGSYNLINMIGATQSQRHLSNYIVEEEAEVDNSEQETVRMHTPEPNMIDSDEELNPHLSMVSSEYSQNKKIFQNSGKNPGNRSIHNSTSTIV